MFNQELKTLQGEIIKENNKPVTLLIIAQNALMANPKEEIDGAEKISRYELAQRIATDNPDLKVEEIAKIKELIGKTMPTLVAGQAQLMLEKWRTGQKIKENNK